MKWFNCYRASEASLVLQAYAALQRSNIVEESYQCESAKLELIAHRKTPRNRRHRPPWRRLSGSLRDTALVPGRLCEGALGAGDLVLDQGVGAGEGDPGSEARPEEVHGRCAGQ